VKITVGPPFFNRVNGPLALGLIFLMGVGPLIAWRRMTVKNLASHFATPAIIGIITGLIMFGVEITQWYVLTAVSLVAFVAGTVAVEFRRGISARRHMVHESGPRALVNLVSKNNRRYGGYIIHVGVIMAFIGIVGSSFFRNEVKKSVKPGESFAVGPYLLHFQSLTPTTTPHLESATAAIDVTRDGHPVASMYPAKLFFKKTQQPATHVAIRSTPLYDLYVVLAGIDEQSGMVTFQVFLTPLVFWLWAGGLVMVLGTVITMWPNVRERAAIAEALSRSKEIAAAPAPGGE
jgi:cytochrome c-type biogenesis protein CcmF